MRNFGDVKEPKYNVGEYVSFKSTDPLLHLNRMFGNLKDSEISEHEYKGIIKKVYPNPIEVHYTITSLLPIEGFLCDVLEYKILQIVSREEIEHEIELRNQKYANFVE